MFAFYCNLRQDKKPFCIVLVHILILTKYLLSISEFEGAATELKGWGIPLIKIDGTKEKELADQVIIGTLMAQLLDFYWFVEIKTNWHLGIVIVYKWMQTIKSWTT
jgi:hypothetical protein